MQNKRHQTKHENSFFQGRLNNKLIELVHDFTEYTVKDLQELFRQGANAKLEVHSYNNIYHSLADKLMIAIFNSDITNNPITSKKALDILNELFINGAKYSNSFHVTLMLYYGENSEITNTCVASAILLNNINLKYMSAMKLLKTYKKNSAANIVFLDKKLKTLSDLEIKPLFLNFFKYIILESKCSLEHFYPQILILFAHGFDPSVSITNNDIIYLKNHKNIFPEIYNKVFKDTKIEYLL